MLPRSPHRDSAPLWIAAALACAVLLCPSRPPSARSQPARAASALHELNDCHLHLTNYVQDGPRLRDLLATMGTRVRRAAVFGIPLQQKWSYPNSGNHAPTYYLNSDAPLYYYAFTDAHIALEYLSLPKRDRARFDPMITGFNPSDMYATDHIRRVLLAFPGVFSGIGEFSIHKEFVSAKIADGAPSLTDPALDRVLAFAAEVGLVVLIHNDIDAPFAEPGAEPVYFEQMRALLERHPDATIIWAHTGLGRIVRHAQVSAEATERAPTHLEILEAMLADAALAHVAFDISWDEVGKYAVSSPAVASRVAGIFNRYPDRFLFGTDTVAPAGPHPYYSVFDLWAPIWKQLTPEASLKVRRGNYERVFDEGRRKVRAWENANVR